MRESALRVCLCICLHDDDFIEIETVEGT